MIEYMVEIEGYRAKIERARDGMLHGRVIGLDEVINFKAPTKRIVERQFAKALEAYFDRCRTRGVEPQKPKSLGF